MKRVDWLQTRDSLLQRLKNLDDDVAWRDFFNIYWKLIYGVARKAGLSDAEGQDVVQETMLTVVKKIGSFEVGSHRGHFSAWLLNIVRWRVGDRFRNRLRGEMRSAGPGSKDTGTAAIDAVADAGDWHQTWNDDYEQNLLETALERVKPRVDPALYQIFHLHAIRGMSARDVALKMEVKLPRVYFAKCKVSRLVQNEVHRLRTKLI